MAASTTYVNSQSNTGICTASFPSSGGSTGVTPVLTSLSVSQAGPTLGPNAKLTIWDGAVGSGTAIFAVYLAPPMSASGLGSVGIIQDIPLPRAPNGVQCIQATPGNQMNIQVTGTGNNQVSINARFSDGLPTTL